MNLSKDKMLKLLDPLWFRDFFAFKINVFPMVVRFIYVLLVLFCILGGIRQIAADRVFQGIVCIILGPILLHIAIEFFLLLFVIVDLLREIRDKIMEK